MRWTVAAAGLVLVAAPLLLAWEARYADGPPPGFTGDFGEPTCGTCHMDAPVRPEDPGLAIEGVPDAFRPGSRYRLTISASRPGIAAAGFQLSVRTAAGMQAGELRASDARVRIVRDSATGVAFASHSMEGTALVAPDSARWTIEWTAPAEADSVVFSAAANAANGDDSNFGDEILTRRKVTVRKPSQK